LTDMTAYVEKEIDELLKRDNIWRNKYAMIQNDLAVAWNLRCCGNCKYYDDGCYLYYTDTSHMIHRQKSKHYCDEWKTDRLTLEERRNK